MGARRSVVRATGGTIVTVPPSNPNRASRGLERQGPACRSRSRLQRGQAENGVATFPIEQTRLVDPCAIIGTWKRLVGRCRSEMLQPLWCPSDYASAWIARLYRRYFRSCCNGDAQSHDIRAKLWQRTLINPLAKHPDVKVQHAYLFAKRVRTGDGLVENPEVPQDGFIGSRLHRRGGSDVRRVPVSTAPAEKADASGSCTK